MNHDTIINDCAARLMNGNVILFPSDTNWSIGCFLNNYEAIKKFRSINKNKAFDEVLLVNSIDMLKKYIPQIHPRVETLLSYNKRPLTILYDNLPKLPFIDDYQQNKLAIRLVHNSFCLNLINQTDTPILSIDLIHTNPYKSISKKDIPNNLTSQVDYVCNLENMILKEQKPSVMVSFDQEGDLHILRP
jgi:L-threonylcarbamoyladenylate synthase